MDLLGILSEFAKKYVYQVDREEVDVVLQKKKRIKDLGEDELEFLGFSIAQQIIYASFVTQNQKIRDFKAQKGSGAKESSGEVRSTRAQDSLFKTPGPRNNSASNESSSFTHSSLPENKKEKSAFAIPSAPSESDGKMLKSGSSSSPRISEPMNNNEGLKIGKTKSSKVASEYRSSDWIKRAQLPPKTTTAGPSVPRSSGSNTKSLEARSQDSRRDSKIDGSTLDGVRSTLLTKNPSRTSTGNPAAFSLSPYTLNKSSQSPHGYRGYQCSVMDLPIDESKARKLYVAETPDLIDDGISKEDRGFSIPETEYPTWDEDEICEIKIDQDSPILSDASVKVGKRKHNFEDLFVDCHKNFKSDSQSSPSILTKKSSSQGFSQSLENNKWGIPQQQEFALDSAENNKMVQGKINSFFKTKGSQPYVEEETIRKKADRRQLEGFDCEECRNYYKDSNLSNEEVAKLLKECSRHRARHPPPVESQKERWELEIRDDIDDERNKTQMGPPLQVRKRRKNDS